MLDQIDRYKLASPPDNEPPEEGEGDWTAIGDVDFEEHLHDEEGDDY